MITEKLIQSCRRSQRDAQREVYELMAPQLHKVCRRYIKLDESIEEVLADTFFHIFTKLDQLNDDALFEAWARKIAVNICLMHLRTSVNFNIYIEDSAVIHVNRDQADSETIENDLMNLLNHLPEGCRTVFNLYAIEGYSHKEIAEQLQISEGTSKSQLNSARTKLQRLVQTHYYKQAK